MSPCIPQELAQLAIEAFIRDGIVIEPPDNPTEVLALRAGVFVTLRKSGGQLRGCIGTIEGERSNVACEIVHNAISAATRDPRISAGSQPTSCSS
jgi:AMMECR1 domain-containing protein